MAGVQHQQVVVGTKQEFDAAVQNYIAMGFGPRQMSNELAILYRASQQKGLGCAFWFWVIFFFPIAIIMLMMRSNQPGEQTVTIRLEQSTPAPPLPGPASFAPQTPQTLQMSEDRRTWWDGQTWVAADRATPPMARRSTDGNLWWDGQEWRAVS